MEKSNIALIAVIFSGVLMIFQIGMLVGMKKAWADQDRVDCEVKFDNKPQSEITGECLKYFKQ